MEFSIVIPTFNNLKELKKCLDSLGNVKKVDFEVLICVDGSTDSTPEFLNESSFPFPFRNLEHPDKKNHGRSAARNLALPHLNGKYTLFLDSDLEISPDLLEKHLVILKTGNTVSLGLVKYRNLKNNLWAKYISTRGYAKYAHSKQVPSNYFITQNAALPTEMVKSLSGFDEKINRYGGEDMEFGHRVWLKYQAKFVFNAKAVVETVQDKNLDSALAQLREYGATGLPYIVKKFPELSRIYWVEKCNSSKFSDQLFEFLTIPPFQKIMRWVVPLFPFVIQKFLINYLVISTIHEGFRKTKRV